MSPHAAVPDAAGPGDAARLRMARHVENTRQGARLPRCAVAGRGGRHPGTSRATHTLAAALVVRLLTCRCGTIEALRLFSHLPTSAIARFRSLVIQHLASTTTSALLPPGLDHAGTIRCRSARRRRRPDAGPSMGGEGRMKIGALPERDRPAHVASWRTHLRRIDSSVWPPHEARRRAPCAYAWLPAERIFDPALPAVSIHVALNDHYLTLFALVR